MCFDDESIGAVFTDIDENDRTLRCGSHELMSLWGAKKVFEVG
jgi:hypothetical protein